MKFYLSRAALSLWAALVITACAGLGVPPADTWNKKVYAAAATITGLASSAAQLKASGVLSAEDAGNLVTQLQTAQDGVRVADGIHTNCVKALPGGAASAASTGASDPCTLTAQNRLDVAVTALTAVQAYLNSKGAKP